MGINTGFCVSDDQIQIFDPRLTLKYINKHDQLDSNNP